MTNEIKCKGSLFLLKYNRSRISKTFPKVICGGSTKETFKNMPFNKCETFSFLQKNLSQKVIIKFWPITKTVNYIVLHRFLTPLPQIRLFTLSTAITSVNDWLITFMKFGKALIL